MPPKKKKSQTRLTFEPVGASLSPPASTYSPAKVRYSRTRHVSPNHHRPSMATLSSSAQTTYRSRTKKSKQARLDYSPPPASFMPKLYGLGKRPAAADSSDDSAAEVGGTVQDEDNNDFLPPAQKASRSNTSNTPDTSDSEDSDEQPTIRNPRSSQSVSTRLQRTVMVDDDSDDDELEAPKLTSPRKRRHSSIISLHDSDDAPIRSLEPTKKLANCALAEFDDLDEDIVSPSKRRKMFQHSSPSTAVNQRTPGRLKRRIASTSSPKCARKGHRSEKQRKMELLRRRRAGEKIGKLTSSESGSSEDEKRGIYDSDSQDEFEVLRNFDDDEEEEVGEEKPAPCKGKGIRQKPKSQNNDDSDLEDFVTDDDDAPLGAPIDIPLEFTLQAHKPLKEQFPYVIEWLVHNRINPAFERKDPVYVNAWRKLDDEFSGLANSKFTSSAWKPDFHRALKSRPRLESFELGAIGSDRLYETCEACGRSGHPSTWKIVFSGPPYHKDTLAEVDSDTSDLDGDNSETASVDAEGMPLPPTAKEWCVGAVCCSNAETAHSLLHWKYALKEWVEDRLEDEKWMTAQKLRERENMKAKKRRALTHKIVDGWQQNGTINALYGDFKNTLENARNKQTTGRGLRGRFR